MPVMNTTLLPIGTRVKHDGHGPGTIVAHNGAQRNVYVETNLGTEHMNAVVTHGLGAAIVASFYSGDRFPYVVKFDPSERYPEGYQDVYDVDGAVMEVM